MRLTKAEIIDDQRYLLILTIDGREAVIHDDVKPTLLSRGYVPLGYGWDDKSVTIDNGEGEMKTLPGVIESPKLAKLIEERYANVVEPTIGPVEFEDSIPGGEL